MLFAGEPPRGAVPPPPAGADHDERALEEWARHRAAVCAHAPAALLLLLKRLRHAHYLAAEYLGRLVCDSNFLLLALKFLNQARPRSPRALRPRAARAPRPRAHPARSPRAAAADRTARRW